jgi:hypothetical protein
MTIQPRFVGIGLGLALGIACLAAMAPSTGTYHGKTVTYGPDPWNMVQIREGTPYVVPAGKLFVPTALGIGSTFNGAQPIFARLLADGQEVAGAYPSPGGAELPMKRVPIGLALAGGTTLTVEGGVTGALDARAWGYVQPASAPIPSTSAVVVPYGPAPESFVQIPAGTPYVVPADRILVVTAFGGFQNELVTLEAAGQVELSIFNAGAQTVEAPVGLTFGSGALVSVIDHDPNGNPISTTNGRCWGYLANR